jgi:hypothetical protein
MTDLMRALEEALDVDVMHRVMDEGEDAYAAEREREACEEAQRRAWRSTILAALRPAVEQWEREQFMRTAPRLITTEWSPGCWPASTQSAAAPDTGTLPSLAPLDEAAEREQNEHGLLLQMAAHLKMEVLGIVPREAQAREADELFDKIGVWLAAKRDERERS